MGETRRMHFVPRTYLNKFAVARKDQYYVNALDKGTGKIFAPNTTNICLETDIYRLDGDTEEERQRLELAYKEMFEDGYDGLYAILTDENREVITMEERYDIIAFGVSLLFRNNAWNISINKVIDDAYAAAYRATIDGGKDRFFFEGEEICVAGKSLEELQKEARQQDGPRIALTALENIFKTVRLRVMNDVVTVVKTPAELLTSDNPVIFRDRTKGTFQSPMDPDNTLSVPIDNCHLLQLRPWGHELDKTMLGRMSDRLLPSFIVAEMNNQFQFRQTGRFLIGSEKAVAGFEHDPSGEAFKKRLQSYMTK